MLYLFLIIFHNYFEVIFKVQINRMKRKISFLFYSKVVPFGKWEVTFSPSNIWYLFQYKLYQILKISLILGKILGNIAIFYEKIMKTCIKTIKQQLKSFNKSPFLTILIFTIFLRILKLKQKIFLFIWCRFKWLE